MDDDRIGYITEYQKFEYLYQHFKYELTLLLSSNKNISYLKQIKDLLEIQTNFSNTKKAHDTRDLLSAM